MKFKTLALSVAVSLSATALAAPDFNGVWQPLDPPVAFKPVGGGAVPLLPAPQAIYTQREAQFAKGDLSFDPTSTRCAPPGEPRIMTESMPFDIVQTKKEIAFGYQWNRLVRFVYLDKPVDVVSPYYFGTSNGHFEGKTLVIDDEGFNDKFFLDRSGLPHRDQLKLTEYFSLSHNGATLSARIHVEDPATFSKPWDVVLNFKKLPKGRIAEDICTIREHLIPKDLEFFDPQ